MKFAVVMRKQKVDNPWIDFRWAATEVLPDYGQFSSSHSTEKIMGQFLGRDEQGESWLFTGYELDLYPDDAEGYYLNVSATFPCWFVMWRMEEDFDQYIDDQSKTLISSESGFPIPHRVDVSYNEAAHLIDSGETVDNIPMNDEHASWLQGFVNQHFRPEPKKRHKPASFKGANRSSED